MAATVTLGSSWSEGVETSTADMRRAQAAALSGDGGIPLGGRGGVVRHSDASLQVTVNSADVITVQRGTAIIPGNAVASSGVWIASLAANTTITLDPRHVTNPRVDLVVVRQLDSDVVPTHGAKRAQIEVLTGTPAPAPSAPALPDMAVEIGRVTVYPSDGAVSVVDRTFVPYAVAAGGTYVASTLSRLPSPVPKWSEGRALDTGLEYTFNGTSWVSAAGGLKMATGTVSLSDGGAELNTKTVNLPSGLFSSPPRVFLQPETGALASTSVNYYVSSRTSSSFVANLRRSSTTTTVFSWFAVGD